MKPTNWAQRAEECDRRARAAYPAMLKAKQEYERYSKLWTYWSNRSIEAQRRVIEVKKIPASDTRAKVEELKTKMHKAFENLTPQQQERILKQLRKEITV